MAKLIAFERLAFLCEAAIFRACVVVIVSTLIVVFILRILAAWIGGQDEQRT